MLNLELSSAVLSSNTTSMTGKKVGEFAMKQLKKSVMNPYNIACSHRPDDVIANHGIGLAAGHDTIVVQSLWT